MTLSSRLTLAVFGAALLALNAQDAPSPATLRDLTPAILPTPRLDVPWWADRHNAIVESVSRRPDVHLLLIGDSITQNYEKSNPPDEDFLPIWKQFYEPRHALNLGFSGDTTANVLWRITHGEIDGLRPQAVVVLIGTNNTAQGQTAEQAEAGIGNIVGTLTQRLPQTRILLLGILPSDVSPEKTSADKAINEYLAKRYGSKATKTEIKTDKASTGNSDIPTPPTAQPRATQDSDPRVTYLDISSIFMDSTGALKASIFYDPRLETHGKPLHPDTRGQRMMAEAIEPALAKLMYDKSRATPTPMAMKE